MLLKLWGKKKTQQVLYSSSPRPFKSVSCGTFHSSCLPHPTCFTALPVKMKLFRDCGTINLVFFTANEHPLQSPSRKRDTVRFCRSVYIMQNLVVSPLVRTFHMEKKKCSAVLLPDYLQRRFLCIEVKISPRFQCIHK